MIEPDEEEEPRAVYGTTFCFYCVGLRPIDSVREAKDKLYRDAVAAFRASLSCGHEKTVVRPL